MTQVERSEAVKLAREVWIVFDKYGDPAGVPRADEESARRFAQWGDEKDPGFAPFTVQKYALSLLEKEAGGEGEGWRTIRSAPEDGTPVLMTNGERVVCAAYMESIDDDGCEVEGWETALWDECLEPTHWRPLPPPPASPSSGEPE